MKEISTQLEQELEKMGFWNDGNDCWKYSNDEDVTFETALYDFHKSKLFLNKVLTKVSISGIMAGR